VALPDLLLPLLQASLAAASTSGRAGENPPGLSRELAINASKFLIGASFLKAFFLSMS
jgi:hypothetical protein